MTPYYQDDTVSLYCGDMRKILPALDVQPDCAIADPPYGETALAWDRWPDGWPALVAAVARSMWCFGSMRMFLDRRDEFTDWRLSQDVVWEKPHGSGFASDRFKRVHEHALHWYRGRWCDVYRDPQREPYVGPDSRHGYRGGTLQHTGQIQVRSWVDDGTRLLKSVLRRPSMWRRGAIHPTEKSVDILNPLVQYACPSGGLILDPFAGSCSTGVAARLTGRRAVLIEADEAMCEKAVQARLAQDVLPLAVTP